MFNCILKSHQRRKIFLFIAAIVIFTGLMIVAFHYHEDGEMRSNCPICRLQILGTPCIIEEACVTVIPDTFISPFVVYYIETFHVLQRLYNAYPNAPPFISFS